MKKLLVLLLLVACNPVKQVLKDEAKIKKVFDEGVRKGWCVNDTLTKSDTIVSLDTLYMLETATDTVRKNDTVYITSVKDRYIERKTVIHDTSFITDKTFIDLLSKDIIKLKNEKADLKNTIADQKNVIADQKKQLRQITASIIILIIIGLLILFHKPLLNLISPLKIFK